MTEVRVTTWNDLQDALYSDSWNMGLQRYRSPFVFRGLSDMNYRLETTLIRLGGEFQKLEAHLLRNFRKYAHRDMVQGDSTWHWLSVAQHHGLPTRLLDWTYSPFVAMHFATANITKFDIDGAIWAVNYLDVHRYLPEKLQVELDRVGAHAFDVEMLSKTVKSFRSLNSIASDDFALFFEPASIDDRIVNQFALFSMMSNPVAVFDEWLVKHQISFKKVIIPTSLKWEVRDKLDQANITERVLFPGLDGLSIWLKRHYTPKVG